MKITIKILLTVFVFSLLLYSGCGNKDKDTVTDKDTTTVTDIDGNEYKTVKIGKQIWLAENLKVSRYRNGDAIPVVENDSEWGELDKGAYCVYDNKYSNSSTYGFLYNWYAVNDPRGLAPIGWHIPSDAEWQTLIDFLGGDSVAGDKLKGTTLWKSPNEGATNESGFSAFPGGYRNIGGNFSNIGLDGNFWSATENANKYAWYRILSFYYSDVYRYYDYKLDGFCVRCVRDY